MNGKKPKIEQEIEEFFASPAEEISDDEPDKEEDCFDPEIRKLLAEF